MASSTNFGLEAEPGYTAIGFKLKRTAQHDGAADRAPHTEGKVRQSKLASDRQAAVGGTAEALIERTTDKKCLERADALIRSGNNSAAIQHLEAALNDSSDSHLQKQIWRLLGNCHSSAHSYKKASIAYLHYLGMCRELGDFPGATRAYCCLGITYMHQGLYTLAGNCFLQHLDNSQIMRNKVAMASAYNNLGVLTKLLGKRGMERAHRTGNTTTMNSVASQLHRAISYFAEHLMLVEQLHDRSKQCVVFGNLGACHEMLMEYPQAIHYHYQRLVLAHRLRDYRSQSRALCNIGNCLRAQGQLQEACIYYLKDLEVCRLIRDEQGEIVTLLNLATTSEALGDRHKSIEWHSLLLGIRMKRDDKVGQVKCLMLLGALYYETEQLMKAKDYFTRVVDLSQVLGDHELHVKSLLILEEIQRAIKKKKHSRYNSVRKSLRRFKRRSVRSMLPTHAQNDLPTQQQKFEATHASSHSLSRLGGSGDTPMIKPRDQKDRVKLGAWSPGLKRWVNESGHATLHGDGISADWSPSPVVIANANTATHDVDEDDDKTASQFSLKDSVHGYLNDNKQLSYQLEDVLMSAAAKTDEGLEPQRASTTSTVSLYSRAFGNWRHVQELRVIGQDMCKPAVELGLSRGGEEWKEWVLSPNDDRKSVRSLSIDETMFDTQQSATQQITVQLEQPHPHPPSGKVQESPPTSNQHQAVRTTQEQAYPQQQSHSVSHNHRRQQQQQQQQQQSPDQQQPRPSDQQASSHNSHVRRPISPVDPLEGVEAVISCLEAVLQNEDLSDIES